MKNWNKIKPKINLVIDAIMLFVMMAVAGLGFLMKFVLLPGYRINEIYGAGTELYFWGLDRHQWGAIHLYLALFLVFLLVLHIILHWDMIITIFRQMIEVKVTRYIIAISVGAIVFILVLAPLSVKPEIAEMERRHNRNRIPEESFSVPGDNRTTIDRSVSTPAERPHSSREQQSQVTGPPPGPGTTSEHTESDDLHRHHNDQIEINGTMTLNEISVRYNIDVSKLARVINVPAEYANERLGRLKRSYGFEMDTLRIFVADEILQDN